MKNKLENIWTYTQTCVYLYKLNDKKMEKYTEQIEEIARFATNRGLEITLENIEEITRQWYLSKQSHV